MEISSAGNPEENIDIKGPESEGSEKDVVVETLRRFFPGITIVQNEDEIIVQ